MKSKDIKLVFGMTGIQTVFFALMMLLSAGMIIGLVAVKPSAPVLLVVLAVGYPALFYGAGYLVEKVYHLLNRHGHF